IRRLITSAIVLIITTTIVFLLIRLLPGDPVLLYLTKEQSATYTPEQLEILRHQFGLDKPIFLQYADWLKNLLHGNLGTTVNMGKSVNKAITDALPVSIYIGGLAWIIGNLLGIFIGIISAIRRGKIVDTILTVFANIGITVPGFWLAVICIYIFNLWLGWLPGFGYTPLNQDFILGIKQTIMPVGVLCVGSIAGAARLSRSCMLEVLAQDYLRTAYSKGLTEKIVIMRHALKNAMLPMVTVVGMSIPAIIGGQVLIEQVYAIPGMGRLAVTALFSREYAIIQAIVLLVAIVVLLSNLLVDIAYGWLDPRVRYN
ncbi:MAG: ABC transporter permease, partial [Dehalococcoidales bacterium]|nr:ABC transporter permease [Dehalococcoidales bacterium]